MQIGEHAEWDYITAAKTRFSPTNEYSFDPRMSENFRLGYLRHAGITAGNIRSQMRELHAQPREPTRQQTAAYEQSIQLSKPMTPDFACPAGMPVLFVHGHRGSAPQVSSFAAHSVAARRGSLLASGGHAIQLSWFSVDYHEASTAFHAGLMRAQAAYLNDAVNAIRGWYTSSLCAPVTSNGQPPPVQLIAHSMGGVLARLAVLLPNHDAGSFTSVLALNSPHQAHPVDTDASAAALYTHMNRIWHASSIGAAAPHLAHLSGVFMASITSGYSDPLVRPDLTRLDGLMPPSRSLWAALDAIPGAWCSSGHQNIVACGPFLARVVRALHTAAAVAAAGGNTTAEATAQVWHDGLLMPGGIAPPVRVASASQQVRAEQQELSDWKHAFNLGVLPSWLASRTKLSDGVYLTPAAGNRILAVTAEGVDLSGALTLGEGQRQEERRIVGRGEGEARDEASRAVGDVPADTPLRVCVQAPASVMPALAKRELLVTVVSNQPPPCAVRGGACVLGPAAALPLSQHSNVVWNAGGLGMVQDNSLLADRQYPLHAAGVTQRIKASWGAGAGEHKGAPSAPPQLVLSDDVAQWRADLPRHALSETLPYAFSAWSARGRLPPPPLSLAAPAICVEWPRRDALADSTWMYMHVAVAPRASSGVQPLQAPTQQVHGFQLLRHWGMLLNPVAWMAWLVTGKAVFTSVTWRMAVGAPPLAWLGLRGAGQLVQLHPFLGYQVSVSATQCGAAQAPPSTPSSQTPAMWHAVAFGDAAAGPRALWHAAPIVAHSSAAAWDRGDSSALAQLAQATASLFLGWPTRDAASAAAADLGDRNVLGRSGSPSSTMHWLKVTHFANTSAVPALSILSDPRCHREVRLAAAPSSILFTWLPQRLPWLLCTLCSVIMLHLALAQGLWVARRIRWKRGKRLWRARLWEYACHASLGTAGELPQPQLPQYARFPSLAHVQRHMWLPLLLLSVAMAVASASLRAALHPPLDWQRGSPHPGLGTPIEWRQMTLQEHLALHLLCVVLVAAYCRLLSAISRVFGWGGRAVALVRAAGAAALQRAFRRGWLPQSLLRRCCVAHGGPASGGFLDVAYRKRTSSHSTATGGEVDELQLPPLGALDDDMKSSGSGGSGISLVRPVRGWRSVWDALVEAAVPAAVPQAALAAWVSTADRQEAAEAPGRGLDLGVGAETVLSPPRVNPHIGSQTGGGQSPEEGGIMIGLRASAQAHLRHGMQQPHDAADGLQLGAEMSLGFESDSTEPEDAPAASALAPAPRSASPHSPPRSSQPTFKVGMAPSTTLVQPPRIAMPGPIYVKLPEDGATHVHAALPAGSQPQPITTSLHAPAMPPLRVSTQSHKAFSSVEGFTGPSLVRSGSVCSVAGGLASPLHSSLALSSMSLTSKSVQRAATGLRSLTLGVTMPRVEASAHGTPSHLSARGIGVGSFDTPPSPLRAGRGSSVLQTQAERMPRHTDDSMRRCGSHRRLGSRGSVDAVPPSALGGAGGSPSGDAELEHKPPPSRPSSQRSASDAVFSQGGTYSSSGSAGMLPPPVSVAAAAALSFHSRAAAAAAADGGDGAASPAVGHLSSISRALLAGTASAFHSRGGSSTKSGGGQDDEPELIEPEAERGNPAALLLGMPDGLAQAAIGREMSDLWTVQDAQALNIALRRLHWLLHAPAMLVLHALLRCVAPGSEWAATLRAWDATVQRADAWQLAVPDLDGGGAYAAQLPDPNTPLDHGTPTWQAQPAPLSAGARRRTAQAQGSRPSPSDMPSSAPPASARGECLSLLRSVAAWAHTKLQLPARVLAFLQGVSKERAALHLLLLASASAWLALVSIALVMPWLVVAGAFTGLLLQTLLAAATLPPAALLHRAVQAQAAAGSASATGPLARRAAPGRSRSDSVAEADAALAHFAHGAAVAGEAALNETRHQEGVILLYLLLLLSKATSVMYTAEATLQLRHPFHRDVLLALPMALELFAARAGKPLSNSAQLLGQVFLLVVFALVSQGFMYSIAPAVACHAALSLCARVHHALAHTTAGRVGTALYRRLEFALVAAADAALSGAVCKRGNWNNGT